MQFVWEPYTTNVMWVLLPIYLVGSVAWCAVMPLICFQVIDETIWNAQPISWCLLQPFTINDITLKGKHDENWGQLLDPMINQWNNRLIVGSMVILNKKTYWALTLTIWCDIDKKRKCLLTLKMQTQLHWFVCIFREID